MQFNLNEKQQEAVDHKKGPLLIIAGAGTGKTAVITQRIIQLIKSESAKSSEILALTFTEKAASEMQERVDKEMPLGYEEMMITTFHSFCDQILKNESTYLGLDSNYSLMSSAQSYIFFRNHLFDFSLNKFRPLGNPTKNIADILKHFSRLQDEDVLPEDYTKYAKNLPSSTPEEKENKAEAEELSKVFTQYIEFKTKESKLDFADLISLTIKLFRSKPNILEKYRKQFKYILVDEFQDTNYAQNELVNLLANREEIKDQDSNITVVGDDDQAIYKFRGAAISNIMQFNSTYPDATKVVLTENYRSRQEILDSAYRLISHNNPYRLEIEENINKQLHAAGNFDRPEEDPVQLIVADTGSQEADLVAKEIIRLTGNIEKLKDDNSIVDKRYDVKGQSMFVDVDKVSDKEFKFSDIAILVRANAHTDEFIQALKYYGIPFKFAGPKGLYTRPEVSPLISFLKTLVDYEDNIHMFNILKMDLWGLSARELVEITRNAKEMRLSIFKSLEALWGIKVGAGGEEDKYNPEDFPKSNRLGRLLSPESIVNMSNLLAIYDESMRLVKAGSTTGEVLYHFFTESGYLEELLSENSYESQFKVQNISKYFNLIKNFETDNLNSNVSTYIDYLDYSMDIGENPRTEEDLLDDYDAVNITTIHGSKGLEYPIVFMVNLVSDRFPTRNRRDVIPIPDELIKEEIPEVDPATEHIREERRLFYVGATRAQDQLYLTAAKIYGEAVRTKKPSVFIDEILDKKTTDEFDKPNGKNGNKTPDFTVKVSTYDDSVDVSQLKMRPTNYVSYSHVSTYENCPKQYKYRYILGLYGPPSSALAFGRSVHDGLKKFYDLVVAYQSGLTGVTEKPTEEDLLKAYDSCWVSEGYESKRHEEIRKKYGEGKMKNYYKNHFSLKEKPIVLERRFKYKVENVIVAGAIDRIDLIGEEDGKQVVELVDYKTGKIRGSEKEVKDNLQLAIYAVAAEELFGYKVAKASLLFVEQDEKIEVDLSTEQRLKAKSKILETVEQINEGKFGANPSFLCNYCDFKAICEDAMI